MTLAAPVYAVGLVAVCVLVLVGLVAFIARSVMRRGRAEDLPYNLLGLSEVIDALTGFLPWRRPRERGALPSVVVPPPRTAPVEEQTPRTVSGTVVTVHSATIQAEPGGAASAAAPGAADREGGTR